MARRKRSGGGGAGGGEWLNTYADMVTLLLTFFILLFSMSSLDAAKFNMLVTAFADSKATSSSKIVINGLLEGAEQEGLAPEGAEEQGMVSTEEMKMTKEDALEQIYETIKQYIEDNNLQQSVSVSKDENNVFIRFMNDMLFEPNSAVLKPADREILEFVGYAVKSVENYAELISINGHTAAIPERPDYEVNDWQLSSARANTVLMFFDDQIGVEPSKMQAIGWGKNKPIASNDTESERSKNRRVEILISGENLLSEQLDNIYEKLVQ